MDVDRDVTDNDATMDSLVQRIELLEEQQAAIVKIIEVLQGSKKKPKRTRKPVDKAKTREALLARLKTIDRAEFARFNDAWLSSFECNDVCEGGAPKDTYVDVIYGIAVSHGFQPRGVVSARQKKTSDGDMKNSVDVDGKRVYVGPRLAFRQIDTERTSTGDSFYITAADRAYSTQQQ